MLRTVIIGSDQDLVQRLSTLLGDAGEFLMMQTLAGRADRPSLQRVLRVHSPQVILLGVDELEQTLRVRSELEQLDPNLPVVAFHDREDPHVFRVLMRAGVRDLLTPETGRSVLVELADVIRDTIEKNPLRPPTTGRMVSFFPAKPGVGTSTIALNLAVAASKRSKTPVLLADLDFDTGLIGFLLNLTSRFTIMDLMDKLPQLDEDLWFQLLSKSGNLHVLPSGRESGSARPPGDQIEAAIDFARTLYGTVCIDLPGNLAPSSLGLLKESDQIFLVLTPEIPALRLARERCAILNKLGLSDRVSILLNRWDRRSLPTLAEAEDIVGARVLATLPNDYQSVHKAMRSGKPVNSGSRLAKRFAELADSVLAVEEPAAAPNKIQPFRQAQRLAGLFLRKPREAVSS